MRLAFTKMHGAGNDFIVIEPGSTEADWNRLAAAMCDRHYGVGADGLLLCCPSEIADVRMRIFNADGSEATACGNGTRCIVKYYVKNKGLDYDGRRLLVETVGGVRSAWYYQSGDRAGLVRVGMGEPQPGGVLEGARPDHAVDIMRWTHVVVRGIELDLALISLGNPHAVYLTREPPSGFPLGEVGDILDHEVVPGGVNFEIGRVLSRRRIETRVWEHGVGETLACGSGACAVAVAAHRLGEVGDEIDVNLRGGTLAIEWDGSSEVFLTGPAETVFRGEWEDSGSGARSSSRPIKKEVLT